ncbi:hypothetical protein DLM_1660 [Aquitalea magnusonii]|uniref:Uncharacterized protein n=2 Tax=Aquitalea magnusonii TaxID=332411 RepID=A0A3G9GID3_9NEIS|nr:hypothetical protein DLM_1660 [Aquitalea magnusonii]
MSGPVLANKLHQQSPSASEVQAWKAEQQQREATQKPSGKKNTASAPGGKVNTTVGGHGHNK